MKRRRISNTTGKRTENLSRFLSFACVDDKNGFTPYTDQTEVNQFISEVVDCFEGEPNVIAYGPTNGVRLGTRVATDDQEGSVVGDRSDLPQCYPEILQAVGCLSATLNFYNRDT